MKISKAYLKMWEKWDKSWRRDCEELGFSRRGTDSRLRSLSNKKTHEGK